MANNKKSVPYLLVKVQGYSANKKYMFAKTFPDGDEISIAVKNNIKTDFISYLANDQDKRHAPKGSVVALFDAVHVKDKFYLSGWAKSISKKPQSEDVIVSPVTISPVMRLSNGQTQVLARVVDPAPSSVKSINELKESCLNAIKQQPVGLDLKGNRGFMIRVGTQGDDRVESAGFKFLQGASPEQTIDHYFGGNGKQPVAAISSLLSAISRSQANPSTYIEVIGFTDSVVFNYGQNANDEKLAKTANFRLVKDGKSSPTFSNAALTIDRQDNSKILRVTALPDRNIVSNIHGLVGSHDRTSPDNTPFILPKDPKRVDKQASSKVWPVQIVPYIDNSNQQFNSILVKVASNSQPEVHQRIKNALPEQPRKGAEGYYFDKKHAKKVESALSDLAGTPALYSTTGSIGGVKHVFIAGRTNEPHFKSKLDGFVKSHGIKPLDFGLYAIEENDSISTLSAMSELLKEHAVSESSINFMSSNPVIKNKNNAQINKRISYIDWLNNTYRQNSQLIAQEFDSEIKAVAAEAGIDWDNSKDNVIWPLLNGKAESIGTTANVKPENPADNGSCYITTHFSSWSTRKGNEQLGLVVTFMNLNKDKDNSWSYASHHDTLDRYNNEIWGESQAPSKPVISAEQIAEEEAKLEAQKRKKIAEKVARADAQKANCFNEFSSLPDFKGQHKGLTIKQLPNFANLVNAKQYTLKSNPSNRAFAFAAYDIHDRFTGYQYVLEDKLLLDKNKPKKKNSWSNKMFNPGFQKDDVKTGLPLGTSHIIGEIDPSTPHEIFYSEGWANAGSNFEVIDKPAVICFDKGNMKKVIGLMTKKYPLHKHIHVSDNDMHSSENGNGGVMAALDSAFHFDAEVVIPDVTTIPTYLEDKLTDTSDLFTHNKRDQLLAQLQNPVNLSDIVHNHILRLSHCKEVKLAEQISLLASICSDEGIADEDLIAIVNEALQQRYNIYSRVEPSYIKPYSHGFNINDLLQLKEVNANVVEKIDYEIIDNKPITSTIEQNSLAPVKISSPNQVPDSLIWNVQVNAIEHPNKPNSTITEVKDLTGDNMEYIAEKLSSMGDEIYCDKQNNRFLAPYKYINLINSYLSGVTGAPKFFAGRSKENQTYTVIRGDFTNQDNIDEIESVVKQLGIKFNEAEKGYVVENANNYIFIKEALIESFTKVNPAIETIAKANLTVDQELLQSTLDQVAFSLGIENKEVAKQQLKLSQHNSKIGDIQSPLLAGMYVIAERKIKTSDGLSSFSSAEKVYAQQKTLQTLLKSLAITQPALERRYRADVDDALAILAKQMPSAPQVVEQAPSLEQVTHISNEASIAGEEASSSLYDSSEKTNELTQQAIEDLTVNKPSLDAELNDPAKLANENANKAEQILNTHDNTDVESTDQLDESEISLKEQLAIFQDVIDISFKANNNVDAPIAEIDSQSTDVESNVSDASHKELNENVKNIDSIEVDSPLLPHKPDYEVRLEKLVDFAQTYLANSYTPEEVMESLREPGSPYYDLAEGFQYPTLLNDIKQAYKTDYSDIFNLPKKIESPFTFISAIEKSNVSKRIALLDNYFAKVLGVHPNLLPKRITEYLNKTHFQGVPNPYVDEDGNYEKNLLKSDLIYIDGFDDITTATGYFAHKQKLLLTAEHNDFTLGNIDNNEEYVKELGAVEKQAKLASIMPTPSRHFVDKSKLLTTNSVAANSKSVIDDEAAKEEVNIAFETKSDDKSDNNAIKVNNNNSIYDELYKLAAMCAQDLMNYEEFYEAVFTTDGIYFDENPFVNKGKLQKSEVVKALIPNGFKSPKSFYESAFKDVQGKEQHSIELSRVAGVLPSFIDNKVSLGEQFNLLVTLAESNTPIPLDKAKEIIGHSFKSWYEKGNAIVPLHDIFAEDLNKVNAEILTERYSDDAIKMLSDVMCVSGPNDIYELAEKIISQWKIRQELTLITALDFQELSSNDQNKIAEALNVSLTPSKPELAKLVYLKLDDIKNTSELRIAQYSYIRAAVKIENEEGTLPSYVYRQLKSLLSEENTYKSVIVNKLQSTEKAKIFKAATEVKNYINNLSDHDRNMADLTPVPTNPEFTGTKNTNHLEVGTYKYIVTEGDPKAIRKPSHITGFVVYNDNQIVSPSAFSFTDIKANKLQPVSRNAITETLSPVSDLFDKQGYIAFTTYSGLYGVIHKDKAKYCLKVINADDNKSSNYNEKSFNDAMERALDFFEISSIEFTDGFSAQMAENFKLSDTASLDVLYNEFIDHDEIAPEKSRSLALDLITKANELEYKVPTESTDIIIQALSIIDELNDRRSTRLFEEIVGVQSELSLKENSLLEHAIKLNNGSNVQVVNEYQDVDPNKLLEELNSQSLNDLNISLALEPELLTLDDIGEENVNNYMTKVIDSDSTHIITASVKDTETEIVPDPDLTIGAIKIDQAFDAHPTGLVGYEHNGNYKFGYIDENSASGLIKQYRLQDVIKNISATNPDIFIKTEEVNKPIFSLSIEEYEDFVRANQITGNKRVDNVLRNTNHLAALSVKDLRLLGELIGVYSNSGSVTLAHEVVPLINDYLKANQIGQAPSDLTTEADVEFINHYFGDNHAFENVQALCEQLTNQTAKRIVAFVYQNGITAAKEAGINIDAIGHINNTTSAIEIDKVTHVIPLDSSSLKAALNSPEEVLASKLKSSHPKNAQLAKIALGTHTGNETYNESLRIKPNAELKSIGEMLYFFDHEKVYKGKLAKAYSKNDLELEIEPNELGEAQSHTISINDASFEVNAIEKEAQSLVNSFKANSINTQVDAINRPFEVTDEPGDIAKFSSSLANDMLARQVEEMLSKVNIPANYQLFITQNNMHIDCVSNDLKVAEYENINEFPTITELNKAILMAKRTIIGADHDNQNKPLRSKFTGSPERVLPEPSDEIDTRKQARSVHSGTPEISNKENRANTEANDEASSIGDQTPRKHDTTSHDTVRSGDASETNVIPTYGIKLKPNVNYSYSEDVIADISSYKTVNEAYAINLNAIKLAKELSKSGRLPTIDDKATLAKYRGWGGLSEILNSEYGSHASKRAELKELLTREEYDSIKRSTLSAYYTAPTIVKSVFNGLERLGLKGGFGLDPAFGIGNFASAMPSHLQDTVTLQAKELDNLTAEIARHIHGKLVRNEGYEKAKIPSDTFDFSVGNIPFGDYKVYDKNHRDLSKYVIHDYFILKSLEVVKPGGFVAFATSSGTLDKESTQVREKIALQADLVGAIRLPTDAFNDNARTQVNSDILFFQKRLPNTEPDNTSWIGTNKTKLPVNVYGGYEEDINISQYFIDNPDMIIGKQHLVSGRFGKKTYRTTYDGNLDEALNSAILRLPENIYFEFQEANQVEREPLEPLSEMTEGKRLGSYHLDSDGDVAIAMEKFEYDENIEEVISMQVLEKVDIKPIDAKRMKGLIQLRDLTKNHINVMLQSNDDSEFAASQSKLNAHYDDFIHKNGCVNKQANKRIFKDDPESALVLSLEKWDKNTKTAEKADIFEERTVFPRKEITHVDNVEDAVLVSLSEKGIVSPEYVELLTDKKWQNIVVELGDSIYLNPETKEWEHSSTYLSGQVRDKLDIALDEVAIDEIYQHNVDNLKKVIPVTIPYYEIRAKLGSSWIPTSDIKDFTKYIISGDDSPCSQHEADNIYKVAKVKGFWEIDVNAYQVNVNSGRTKSEFGSSNWPADKLINAILNNKSIVVRNTDGDGKSYIEPEATAEASAKAELIKDTFKQWLWQSPERTARLEESYNRKANGFVEPRFDGSKVVIEGLATTLNGKAFQPREKQLNGVMRYLVTGRAMFLHDVGVGKSFTLLASIIKGKQIGRHSKPILSVPNAVFPQMQALALGHFPNAKIAMLDAKKLDKNNREVAISQIATNSWDIVIIPHSITARLDIPNDFKEELIQQELSEVNAAIDSLQTDDIGSSRSIKEYQKRLANALTEIEKRNDKQTNYNSVNIAEMGIDAIFVDEADEFVNLDKISNMNHVAGVKVRESAKARALFYLTQYLHDRNDNKGIVLATGTDIRNNIADQFTLLRYLAPDILMNQDVDMFDDFIGTFGEIETQFEIAPEGTGFIEKTRLSKFYNLPELSMMYRQVADVVSAEDANVIRPEIQNIIVTAPSTSYLELFMETLAERAKAYREGDNKHDNLLAITDAGAKAAIDLRFIDRRLPDCSDSKLNMCVQNVLHEYNENKLLNPSQIIFSDIGVPNDGGRFDLYNDIKNKLIDGGIPEDKIVFARDFKTDVKKQELQDRMNSGDIAVTIGTTENMGVGKNVQQRLIAIHDLTIPWRVRDMEQRGGRIERFGNMFENATRYKYSTKGSFDLFKWQKLKQKALFAAQTKKSPRDAAREFDEEINPNYAEVMAAATNDPLIEQSIKLEAEVNRLALLERSFHRAKSDRAVNIENNEYDVSTLKDKLELTNSIVDKLGDFNISIKGAPFEAYKMQFDGIVNEINKSINKAKKRKTGQDTFEVGQISGYPISVKSSGSTRKLSLVVEIEPNEFVKIAENHFVGGLLKSLDILERDLVDRASSLSQRIKYLENQIVSLKTASNNVFEYGDRLISSKLELKSVKKEIADNAELDQNESLVPASERWNDLLNDLSQKEFKTLLNPKLEDDLLLQNMPINSPN